MTEARIASPTVAARPTLRRPWLRQLVAAYLSVAAAAAVFGIGYGLGQLDSGACTMSGWACAVPHALLLAAFLAAALATLLYASHRSGLGFSWFMITAGAAGLVLVSGLPLPLLVIGLLLVPGLTATLRHLIKSRLRP